MSNYRSDPTANAALGKIQREMKDRERLAKQMKQLKKEGRLRPEYAELMRPYFGGIYRHILEKALSA